MRDFVWLTAHSLEEALGLMRAHAGRIRPFAGGTDLMVQLRAEAPRLDEMNYALDLAHIPELRGISLSDDTLRIGAMTTHTQAAASPLAAEHAPLLASACRSVGAQQTRNAGTLGGNVCNAAVAADTLAPLAAADAVAVLMSLSGRRRVPVTEFVTGPGHTCIRPDELLVCFEHASMADCRAAFIKLGRRQALSIARLSAAVAYRVADGRIADARVSPGCVFPAPRRIPEAEALLNGQHPALPLFDACGALVSEEMLRVTGKRWSSAYKEPALQAVVSRALAKAAGMEAETEECTCGKSALR